MQRQAVPLMITESPIVGTGIEYRAAKDSGILVLAEDDGVIEKVTGDSITVKYNNEKQLYINFVSSKEQMVEHVSIQKPNS